jgi:AraC-like DNA-binding protein
MLDELATRTGDQLSQNPDLTVKKAASELGLSVSGLYQRWGADLTPKEYITRLRLAQVKAELARGDRKIRDIAWQFRFCDHYYFSKWFRNLVGVATKQYQLRIRAQRLRRSAGRKKRGPGYAA